METLSAGLVIALIVSLLKPFLETWITPANPVHDGAIRATAALIGVAGEVANTVIGSGSFAWLPAWHAAGSGLVDATTAVATYHLLTSSPAIVNAVTNLVPSALLPSSASPLLPPAAENTLPTNARMGHLASRLGNSNTLTASTGSLAPVPSQPATAAAAVPTPPVPEPGTPAQT